MDFAAQKKQFNFGIEFFNVDGILGFKPIHVVFDRVLEKDSLFRQLCTLWDFDNVVIPGASFKTTSQDVLETVAHTEKLHPVRLEIPVLRDGQISRDIEPVLVGNVVIIGFAFGQYLLLLLEFEPKRILQSEQR